MTLGQNIYKNRKKINYSQEKLAEELGVTFQAISGWENDKYLPDTDKILKLANIFGISLSSLIEKEEKPNWEYNPKFFDYGRMYTYLKSRLVGEQLSNSVKSLSIAKEMHEGEYRADKYIEKIPFIYHPLGCACHSLAMNIVDDDVISALLLHDVVRAGAKIDELPLSNEAKEVVKLLDRGNKTTQKYFEDILKNPMACLVKAIERCNTISSMAFGYTKTEMIECIEETDRYILQLIGKIKKEVKWNNAAWLLEYQIMSINETLKRTL